jgi:hypothetical protein
MNKKVFFAYVVLISCILLLLGSYMQWKDKLSSSGAQSPIIISTSKPVQKNEGSVVTDNREEDVKPDMTIEGLLSLTGHQDQQVQDVFRNRLEAGETVDFLITGSNLMDFGKPGYAERLKTALEEAYGDRITVTTIGFAETSNVFYAKDWESQLKLSNGYDIILFEPFTLYNSDIIATKDSQAHITAFQSRLKKEVEDAVLVLQPSNPIYTASDYLTQVAALKQFAETEEIPYVDHWEMWPDPDSKKIAAYLVKNSIPNQKGSEVWADALITYFIAE